jgi:flagellar motor protein MotB
MMFRRILPGQHAEDREDIFAPVADLMVGVVFIFIILMIALSLNLQTEPQVPEVAYKRVMAELAATQQALQEAQAQAARAATERDRLVTERDRLAAFVRFVRDRNVVPMLKNLSQPDARRAALLMDMGTRLRQLGINVTVHSDAGTLSLPSGGLFRSGQADPTESGRDTIQKLGAVMAETLPCATMDHGQNCPTEADGSRLGAVYVEGHTDIAPYPAPTERFRDNWDLSAARAIAAYKLLVTDNNRLAALRDPSGEALMGVSGYADTRPADPAATDRHAKLIEDIDRRIEIRLLMAADPQLVRGVLDELQNELGRVDDLVR